MEVNSTVDALIDPAELTKVLKKKYGRLSAKRQFARQERAGIICQLFLHCYDVYCKKSGAERRIVPCPDANDFQTAYRLQYVYNDLTALEELFLAYFDYVAHIERLRQLNPAAEIETKHQEIRLSDFERCSSEVCRWLQTRSGWLMMDDGAK